MIRIKSRWCGRDEKQTELKADDKDKRGWIRVTDKMQSGPQQLEKKP